MYDSVCNGNFCYKLCEGDKLTTIYRGYYISARVLLNLLNELGKKIRCKALPSFLAVFPNKFKNFNNTGARMQDSILCHMTLKSHFISGFCTETLRSRL